MLLDRLYTLSEGSPEWSATRTRMDQCKAKATVDGVIQLGVESGYSLP